MNKISFLICTIIASVLASEVKLDEGVLILTDDNFDEVLKENPNMMIEFYAPWCGHCKKLAPLYAQAATQLSSMDPPQLIGKVDCTTETKLKEKYEIKGFPSLKFFKNGEPHDYKGKRDTKAIVEYVQKQTMPASLPLTCKKLEKRIVVETAIMVFFGSAEEALYKDTYIPFATTHPKIKFFTIEDAECAAKYNSKVPGILFKNKNFEEGKQIAYDGAATLEALDAWVAPMMIPKYFEWSDDEYDQIFKKDQLTLVLFRDDKDKDEAYAQAFEKSAKLNEGKSLFSWNNGVKGAHSKGVKILGANEQQFPQIIAHIQVDEHRDRFLFPGNVKEATTDQITAFLDDVKAGKVDKYFKSEEIPAPDGESVKTVVGKSYNDIVLDKTKDVLLMYYAPWCGHCKKLKPIWDELAKDQAKNEDIVIAKMDWTQNEVDGVTIKSFPTIFFYPKDNKAGVKYEKGRAIENFQEYLAENASTKATKHDEL